MEKEHAGADLILDQMGKLASSRVQSARAPKETEGTGGRTSPLFRC